jgi:two-component system, cell cycle sensor histidine kinase and response regulator CckA
MLNPAWLPPALTITGMLALCLAVFWYERVSRVSLSFVALSASLVVWQAGMAGMYSAGDPESAARWMRAAYLGVPLIPAALLGFVASLLRTRRPTHALLAAAWLGGLGFVVLAAMGHLPAGVQQFAWGYFPRYGVRELPFLLYFFVVVAYGMWLLVGEYRAAMPGIHRARMGWMTLAFASGYVGILDFGAKYGMAVYPAGSFALLLFAAVALVTLRRYRLVDLTPSFAAGKIVATMADPLMVVDVEGRIAIANPAAAEVLGISEEQLVGSRLDALSVPGAGYQVRLRDLCAGVEARDRETVLQHANGEPIDVRISASPLYDSRGRLVGTVLIARDVRERQRTERALRESEIRFRSLIENITDAIVVLDASGVVTFASASMERVTGYTPAERVGRSALELVYPVDRPEVVRRLAGMMREPAATAVGEYRLRHRDGSLRVIEATASNLLADPAVEGVIVSYHDITERRAAEAALEESRSQLLQSQKMEAVGRLAGGIAHDFNNLLTVVQGQTRLLRDGLLHDDEVPEALEQVLRAADRAATLTRQLLTFSRKQIRQPRVLELNRVVAEMEPMLRRLLGEDLDLLTELGPAVGSLCVDPGQLEQVLLNLAVNARDAMPEGGTLTIRTREERRTGTRSAVSEPVPAEFVVLEVADTGCGMEPELVTRIFEPFFTTKEVGKGTGLGLSTVYGIVEQSDGWLEVESAPGEGALFRIGFPRVDAPLDAPLQLAPAEELPEGRGTVLVAEDEDAVRLLVRHVLRRGGYHVLEAAGPNEALAHLESGGRQIDLLLTDVIMPGANGRLLFERMRARVPDLRVLFMSGYPEQVMGGEGILEPGAPFLAKPFEPGELLRAVRTALQSELAELSHGAPDHAEERFL